MFDYLWVIWLSVGLILLMLEIFTPGFVISLIGIACIVSGVTAVFIKNIIIQFIVFIIVLILLMIYIRPIFLKYLVNSNAKKSNVDALIGQICIVDSEIDNLKNKGYIKVGADYWKAKSIDGNIIPKGSSVKIEKMEGITATVSLIK
jgi:membrane protein implicated in regulation of membrane protease activity